VHACEHYRLRLSLLEHVAYLQIWCDFYDYASSLSVFAPHAESLADLLDSELGRAVVALPEEELFGLVLNDFYKPKMHKVYGALFTAVEADFQLKIRKSPFTLERISDEASSPAVNHTMKQRPKQRPRVCNAIKF